MTPPATRPLCILDWDIVQIEGALLEAWLPRVFQRLDELARQCRARYGSTGAYIEDKNSGTILLQQALRRGYPAVAIESHLTALGKDERALSVSGYVHQGLVKYTEPAFNRVTEYKHNLRTTCSTRSRPSASATSAATAKTTSSIPSAMASPWPSGMEKEF